MIVSAEYAEELKRIVSAVASVVIIEDAKAALS